MAAVRLQNAVTKRQFSPLIFAHLLYAPTRTFELAMKWYSLT
jgi:hypothetical protein